MFVKQLKVDIILTKLKECLIFNTLWQYKMIYLVPKRGPDKFSMPEGLTASEG